MAGMWKGSSWLGLDALRQEEMEASCSDRIRQAPVPMFAYRWLGVTGIWRAGSPEVGCLGSGSKISQAYGWHSFRYNP